MSYFLTLQLNFCFLNFNSIMSTIEKLTIQGIRSFGTKAEDTQTITFASPVTLILGQNGCGKTTIIECLKYALTGEAPPGSNRGQNFIHDPKIFDYSESLGQIKLIVKNIRQERITVCRTMKMGYKRGKPSFGTSDATMSYMGVGGARGDSISKRCIDVDVAMCQFMGVSKAILNNVVFCHQEDSNWPLEEAKKLKEKFDAIFGITEYNKAIEKIIKFRKEYVEDLKVKESNLKYLSHLKQEMEDKAMALQRAREKCDYIKESCTHCDDEIKPIDDRLQEIRKIEYEVGKYQALKVELETKLQNCCEQIQGINKKIRKPFMGTIEELDQEITNFDQKMDAKRKERHGLEDKLNSLRAQEKQLQIILLDQEKRGSSLIQQRQKEQEYNGERAEKIKALCDEMNIELYYNLENNSEKVPQVLEDIKNALLAEQCEIAEEITRNECQDQERQTEIDTLRVNKTKLEENIVALTKNTVQQEKECKIIEIKIDEVQESTNRLKKISEEVEKITSCYEQFSTNLKQDELRQSIVNGKLKITDLQEKFRKVDERLTFCNSISKLVAEISLKKTELNKKNQEVQRVKSKHSENFRRIFDRSVESNFKRSLQSSYENYRRQIKETNEKLNELILKKQSLEIKRKNLKAELSKMEKDVEESKEKIYEKCHSTPYEELLSKSKESVTKYQLEYGALRSSEAMLKRYIKKIEEYPCCPLCHKGISRNEAADLTAELSDEIHRLPENINSTQNLLSAEQKKYESLLQLSPTIEKMKRMENDRPRRKEDLRLIEHKLSECSIEIDSLEIMLGEPTAKLDIANAMLGDMTLLDEAIKEVDRLLEDIRNLEKKNPQSSQTDFSIDDLQLEKTTLSAELENERTLLEKLQKDYEEGIEALNKLREKRNRLKDEQIKLQEGVQSLPQLQERNKELSMLVKNNEQEIYELSQKIQPHEQKLKIALSQKNHLKEMNRKKIEKLQNKHDSHRKIDHDIQRLNKEVSEYQKLQLFDEIKILKESIKQNRIELTEKKNLISTLSDSLEAIKTECLNQKFLERDLKDNRELKFLQAKKIELDKKQVDSTKELGNLHFPSVSREKEELIRKRDTATVRKGELLGQIGELNNQVNNLKQEINEPKYKDSVRNYRRALYDVYIIKSMISDIGQYRITLERSLMQFHSEKMQKINRLIREYWRQIYRGNDIDYIEIQTDVSNTENSSDRKRNYNYRVIQSKNNSEIEMRGRCSAGQRVLACLIIRMALAETFSSNCGVLALDEPTTNLDRVNILSLCEALNRVVDERQTQSNFMIIIITHDEDFITTLGKINNYHRVFRNDDGKSVIRKVKVA